MRVKPKTERNQNVLRYVEKGYTYKDIGRIFHITKGRVAQIVKAMRDKECEPSYQHLKNILGVKETNNDREKESHNDT